MQKVISVGTIEFDASMGIEDEENETRSTIDRT